VVKHNPLSSGARKPTREKGRGWGPMIPSIGCLPNDLRTS
jgi:hypothetical protein